MNIIESTAAYEAWLRAQLGDEVVEKDIKTKHGKMAEGPFPFLRATYWRWAETILDICPELANAASVLAVGDIHLENYGTWRDEEGRLVWGVNDFDEAADMPYALDLVRLAEDRCGAIRWCRQPWAAGFRRHRAMAWGAGGGRGKGRAAVGLDARERARAQDAALLRHRDRDVPSAGPLVCAQR